jgi:SAM-dependent methyltransferase
MSNPPICVWRENMGAIVFNKTCSFEDFENPVVQSAIKDVFHHRLHFTEHRSSEAIINTYFWNTAMTLLALKHFDMLHPDASLLGIGAGTNELLFYLTTQVRRVLAVDLYLNPSVWIGPSPAFMLVQPELAAPFEFDRKRLNIQHMDSRMLNFPDESFDAIFSPNAIQHFETMDAAANAAYEIGRVLSPGGIACISTNFLIKGPPEETGWPLGLVFSQKNLAHYILEASGLEPVDRLDTRVSQQTMLFERYFSLPDSSDRRFSGDCIRVGGISNPGKSRLVIVKDGFVFTSVHLTLRKTKGCPHSDNAWAKPDHTTYQSVLELNRQATAVHSSWNQDFLDPTTSAHTRSGFQDKPQYSTPKLQPLMAKWDNLNQKMLNAGEIKWLPKPLKFLIKSLIRVRYLGVFWTLEGQLFRGIVDYLNTLSNQSEHKNDL